MYRRLAELRPELSGAEVEFVFVDDGSSDGSNELLRGLAENDSAVRVLTLGRNCGHQIALWAGMEHAQGDVVVTLDADLQHPPELIPRLIEPLGEGYDVVHARRTVRKGEGPFKRLFSWMFYRFLRWGSGAPIVPNTGDFRAFTRRALDAVLSFRGSHHFLRGAFVDLGFRQSIVDYEGQRRFAGKSKYGLRRMTGLAVDGILGYSDVAVRGIAWFSFVLWVVSLVQLGRALTAHFVLKTTVPGWTSIIVLLILFTGLILFCLAIVAAYVGRVYRLLQSRPLYWVSSSCNLEHLRTPPVSLRQGGKGGGG
jgi:dolichol-phosphate mannosyltransferase